MKSCPYCGNFDYRLSCKTNKFSKNKTLVTGCCEVFIRNCPNPYFLLKNRNLLSADQIQWLNAISNLDYLSSSQVAVLIWLEEKINSHHTAGLAKKELSIKKNHAAIIQQPPTFVGGES